MPDNAEKWRCAALEQLHLRFLLKPRVGVDPGFARFKAEHVDLPPELIPGHSSFAKD